MADTNKSSVGTLMMIVLVVSMTFVALFYLINIALFSGLENVSWFFPLTGLLPMLLMIIVSWCIKIYRVVTRTEQRE